MWKEWRKIGCLRKQYYSNVGGLKKGTSVQFGDSGEALEA
jgi:hypothetical protein